MPSQVPPRFVDTVPTLHTGHLSDALDYLELPGGRAAGMTVLSPAGMTAIGRAFTLRQSVVDATDLGRIPVTRHTEAARELAAPGDVLIIDVGGDMSAATWGEAQTLRAMARGLAGVIVNGASRDAAGIRSRGFPVACRGFFPARSAGRLHTESIGQTIELFGFPIAPGDLVAFDEDGLVCVPAEHADEVLAKAREISAHEEIRDRELETQLR